MDIAGSGVTMGPWRRVIRIVSYLRRATFLPLMLSSVSFLVIMRGGDSLSVCFNTLAILFMVEADNMAYDFGLAEAHRARMEAAGRIELTIENSNRLTQTRMIYVPVIIGYIVFAVVMRTIFFNMLSGFFMASIG